MTSSIFNSYLMGGFECSTHRTRTKKRVDVIAATGHDRHAKQDYERLLNLGMRTARDGTRWHLIEHAPFQYDWSSVLGQIRAARETGIEIIWDLFHYGYPDDLNILSHEFIERFAAYAEKFTELLISENQTRPLLCLVNEISFYAWAAGRAKIFYPFIKKHGNEIKRQLVRASIAAAERIRQVASDAVLIQTDPVVRVSPHTPKDKYTARNYHNAQYHALEMLLGKSEPELGGSSQYCDVIGVNYYAYNQWRHPTGERVFRSHSDYQPFSEVLKEFYARLNKPLFIAETGIEDDERAEWFRYVCDEVRIAKAAGVPIHGICLYPIVNHPGWDDDRHCHNGLWDYADEFGERELHAPLAEEIRRELLLHENHFAMASKI